MSASCDVAVEYGSSLKAARCGDEMWREAHWCDLAGPDVPPYLRFVGSISIKPGRPSDLYDYLIFFLIFQLRLARPPTDEMVTRICEDLWREKTIYVLDEECNGVNFGQCEELSGRPQMPLDLFINEKFLPGKASNRPQQPFSH